MSSADVIIVGAGVQGASLAFHLADRGTDVLILERQEVAGGSTGRSSGFVRTHYDLASEAVLAWASLPWFEHWDDLVGAGDCAFVDTGFVQLVPPALADRLRANVAMLQGLGIETSLIDGLTLARLVPGIITEDVEVAAWEPRSGYADPAATTRGLLEAAQERGARLELGRAVSEVTTAGDRVTGVATDAGHRAARIVVNAGGPWARELARTVGLELPIRVWRHDTLFLDLPEGRDHAFPIVLDHARQVYFRPDGTDRVLASVETANELGGSPDRPFAEVTAAAADELIAAVSRRLPWLAGASLRMAHCGQDGMTPDQRAIIGPAGPEGHVLLCGFSGSGFKTAPAIGRALAARILDGEGAGAEIANYRLDRFERGEPLVGEHPYPDLWQ